MVRRRCIVTIIISVAVSGCASTGGSATSWGTDLDTWMERDLTPYLSTQLSTHPRFKGESAMLVVFEDGSPTPVANELSLNLRDRLLDSLVESGGINLGWHAAQKPWTKPTSSAAIDCARDQVHYYVGLELKRINSNRYEIHVRALDLEDHTWVTGFGNRWQGPLTTAQRKAAKTKRTDEALRGSRALPFTVTQTDLLAADLAHDLACELSQSGSDEYVAIAETATTNLQSLNGTVELIGNNLARYQALSFTDQADQANAILKGKAHAIDDDLYQYWATVVPLNRSEDLQSLGVSAYIRIPGQRPAFTPVSQVTTQTLPHQNDVGLRQKDIVLASLRIIEPQYPTACATANPWRRGRRLADPDYTVSPDDCFGLELRARRDAKVFLLNHQVNQGMVRLSSQPCHAPTEIRIARAGEAIRFPDSADAWPSALGWQSATGLETFYVVAVTNTDAAEALARQLDYLPERCTVTASPGLAGPELEAWLDDLKFIVSKWDQYIDWRAVRVRHVY